MRLRHLAATAAALLAATACSSMLDVKPVAELPREQALTGPTSARAAVAGMYDALQDNAGGNYYSGNMVYLTDVSSDDVQWTGTFTSFADAEDNNLRSDNGDIRGMWNAMYATVGRANLVLAQLPSIGGLDPAEKDQYLGEAHFVRALAYHDLVRLWGDTTQGGLGVPLVLAPVADPTSSASLTRASVAQVYAQILDDLAKAEPLLAGTDDPTRANLGAVRALRARVLLYKRDYAGAEAAANSVDSIKVAGQPRYKLVSYPDLFTGANNITQEDIFTLTFSAVDASTEGYYYLGRTEVEPSDTLAKAFQPSYVVGKPSTWNPTDIRGQVSITADPNGVICGYDLCGTKYPTTVGAEDIHILRYAEVLLIRAEARARQGGAKLPLAVDDINLIRVRAGLAPLVWGVDLTTQQQVIDEVLKQDRLEFAMEGHRWFDLVRTGLVRNYLASVGAPQYQALYPIPSRELSVSPNIVQNPGYTR